MSKRYNQVYEKLVRNQNDYTGMIAYCIYKDEKRKWIKEGNDPEAFVKLKIMPHELEKYKRAADTLLTRVFQANADEELDRIEKALAEELIDKAKKSLESTKRSKFWSWHNSGASGIFGNFYTGVIVATFVWIFSSPDAWANAYKSASNVVLGFIHTIFG